LKISKQALLKIKPQNGLQLPNEAVFNLPERIISFGTGVLLKGLPYYFVNKANNKGIFNGRILAVKSTPGTAEIESLSNQDFLYTLQSKGIQNGQETEETVVNAAISRILHSENSWNEILNAAHKPGLQIVISNTTEIGLNYPETNDIESSPPKSFPGKLLMFLQERYYALGGTAESGMVIVPTELVTDNGKILSEVLVKLATENNLNPDFIFWLETANTFCNSLVDRIVTGKPDAATFEKFESDFGYTDPNLISSETYRLWAIEGNEKVKEILSFSQADSGCVIADDIEKYRELKLRLLNGSHSLMVGFSYLNGLKSVREALSNEVVVSFMHEYIFKEIISSLDIDPAVSTPYAHEVLDRFRNPNIEHKLLGITVQYSTKMKARVVPILLKYYEKFGKIPPAITKGFAYFLKFMKVAKIENEQYFGELNGEFYPIQDINARYFAEISFEKSNEEYIGKALKNMDLWGVDLSNLADFEIKILNQFKNPERV
jgi:tagaturonate reductase